MIRIAFRQEIAILGLDLQASEESDESSSQFAFCKIGTIDTTYRPISLDGSLIAFSNESVETIIMDWKTGAASLLCSVDDEQGFRVSILLAYIRSKEQY